MKARLGTEYSEKEIVQTSSTMMTNSLKLNIKTQSKSSQEHRDQKLGKFKRCPLLWPVKALATLLGLLASY
jgi:hypothetical protein